MSPTAQTTRARPLLSDERRLLTSPAPRVEMAPPATALFLAGKEIDWYIYDMLLTVSQRFVFPLRSSLVPKWKLFRPAPILSRLSLQLYGLLFRRVSLVSVASLSLHRRETGPRRSSRWFRHGRDEIYLCSQRIARNRKHRHSTQLQLSSGPFCWISQQLRNARGLNTHEYQL